ncbi:DgyrCDS12661 [Dimorphilus gyrociliatus]|uniref:DgyrCDS12661 n=1 Tax=Dimorphilus gyrociliatus TaxID=2664684 RepID=A0A7I8W8M7_9ANNE|nr:DgyrCDS12661 [Dimorphilus gyrociliatus]
MNRNHYRASLGAALDTSTVLDLEGNHDEDFPLLMSTKQRKKKIKQKQKNLSDIKSERQRWNNQLYLHDLVFVVVFVKIWPKHRGLLKRIYVSLTQIVALPLCTCFARVWQCNEELNMEVENIENCWKGPHVAFYCVPSLVIFLVFMVIVPYVLISRAYITIHSSSEHRHEQTLQQVELEKASNVNEPPMHFYLVGALRRKAGLGITGCMLTSGTSTVWLTPTYLHAIITVCFVIWLLVTLGVFAYIIIKLCLANRFKDPMWPTMKLDENSMRFLESVRLATKCLNDSMTVEPILAPSHELSRHIHIINANLREAEVLEDPMKFTLWRTLDRLIHFHSRIAPRSLFSESVKESIRQTAKDFIMMKAKFAKRLAARDVEFALASPVKKRMMLKMYCIAIFNSLGRGRSFYVSASRDTSREPSKANTGRSSANSAGSREEAEACL